jgi:hypothetical protein
MVLETISRKERRKQRRTCDNDAKTMVTLSAVSNSEFRCVGCGEREIDEDNFLLCFSCSSNDAQNYGIATPRNGEFKDRKNNGFHDDEQASAAFQYPMLDTPLTDAARALEETELAWILSTKCEGWTIRNSDAYKKAQRVAAQLAGHYVLGKPFGEVARIVGKEKKAVNKFCVRSREEYFKKLVRNPMPEEVRTALSSGMLRELYPPAVTTGYLVRSASI